MYATRHPQRRDAPFRRVYALGDSTPADQTDPRVHRIEEDGLSRWWRARTARDARKADPPQQLREKDGPSADGSDRAAAGGPRLRIVHVNDAHHFHLGVHPTGALENADVPSGLPIHRIATYLATARWASKGNATDLIYVSAGDEHTGTSLDELLGYVPDSFRMSAGYAFQSVLGLNAATIGNHDLDRGPAVLQKAIVESATFPVLSANIVESEYLVDHAAALLGETRHGITLGIIGVTTDEQIDVRRALDARFTIENPIDATLKWYRRVAPIVDVVIVLSHLGINVPGSRHRSQCDDRVLAKAIAVDAADGPVSLIIGSHTHTVIDPVTEPVEIDGIPVFQAGCNMEYIGDIEIDVARKAVRGRLVPLAELPGTHDAGDAEIERKLQRTIDRTIRDLNRTVLTPVAGIARSEDADIVTTLADRLSGECALANTITDAVRARFSSAGTGSIVVACDASGIQSGLTEKNLADKVLRIDDLYRIMPYADSIFRAILTPAQVIAILGSNALRRIPGDRLENNGGDIGLMDWSRIARGFLHFSGNLRYRIADDGSGSTYNASSSRPKARTPAPTVTDIVLDGKPIETYPDDYQIITYCNSFSAIGNQGWSEKDPESFLEFGAVSLPATGFEDTREPFRTAVIESLMQSGTVSITRDGRLRYPQPTNRGVVDR
ncbi:MAG: bifunctional metallophosphatase/5'-nucleotidase [Alkalispirochaeta sp.]